jgi:ATP-binding cassette subfamily B protein
LSFPLEHPAQIEFVAVEFGYKRRKAMLSVPSLQIFPGEQIAIAGENGAGKSTLAKLMPRIYDTGSGSVRVAGEDVRRIRLDSLRRQVCYLPRDPVLFDGTIATNLRFVRTRPTEDELKQAVACAGLSAFVETLPAGLDQRIGPGGRQLSDGQRQRVAIARALLQRPRILILDEASSCLDPASEILVLRDIRRLLGALTLIVITHRLSTVSTFSRILILSGGRIVQDGNLSAPISTQSAYSKLFSVSHELAQ